MKVLFYCPNWGNKWIPHISEQLSARYDCHITHGFEDVMKLSDMADVLISGWLDNAVTYWNAAVPRKKDHFMVPAL